MDPRHRSLRLVLAALRGSGGPSPVETQDVAGLPTVAFDEMTRRLHAEMHLAQTANVVSGAVRSLLDHGQILVASAVLPGGAIFVVVEDVGAEPVSPETPGSGAHEPAGPPLFSPGIPFPEDDGGPAT